MSNASDPRPRALGVIPARGGSKRFPRKNIALLNGKPLIGYTIEAAARATSLTDYLLSTDDPEIAAIARELGAPVPFMRPASLAGDGIRNIDVVAHALDYMERERGRPYDVIVLLQPTAPIRDPAHIDAAVKLLWASEHPTLASVKGPFRKRDPILKRIDSDGILRAYRDPAAGDPREAFYVYNAALYSVKRDYFKREGRLISDYQVPLLMDDLHSIDVDEESDLVMAEAAIAYLEQIQRRSHD